MNHDNTHEPTGGDEYTLLSADDIRDDLAGGVEALAQAVNAVDLMRITWNALALAERAQHWAQNTVSAADDTEARRFLAAEGLLCDVTGRAVQADAGRFPYLAEAFAKGTAGDGLHDAAFHALHSLGTDHDQAEAITQLHMHLRATLNTYANRWVNACRDAELMDRWRDAEPETRSALLLLLAWNSRDSVVEDGDPYADELNQYARTHTGTGSVKSFFGDHYPKMPLPGPAGSLATSVGFDRDEADDGTSLTSALLLASCTGAGDQ